MSGFEVAVFAQYVLYGWLLIALTFATVTDISQRRIPNRITYPTILIALTAYFCIGGWDGLLFSIGGLVFGFAVLFLPYIMGGMGAGDVKLMSAVGAVLGFRQTMISFLIIAICGGVLAIGFMIYHRNLKQTLFKILMSILFMVKHNDSTLLKVDNSKITRDRIPYGVAITSGVFLFFLYLFTNNKILPAFPVF